MFKACSNPGLNQTKPPRPWPLVPYAPRFGLHAPELFQIWRHSSAVDCIVGLCSMTLKWRTLNVSTSSHVLIYDWLILTAGCLKCIVRFMHYPHFYPSQHIGYLARFDNNFIYNSPSRKPLYFFSPREWPWRQHVFQRKMHIIARVTCVFCHTFKKESKDWRIKDASCSVYHFVRLVTSHSFFGWDKV